MRMKGGLRDQKPVGLNQILSAVSAVISEIDGTAASTRISHGK